MANKVTPKPPISVQVNNLAHDGRGVADYLGKKVFVHGALTGEQVVAQVIRKHRRFLEARTISVEQASQLRQQPECSAFGDCGGCQLQHLGSKDQLAHKQAVVAELLQHHAQIAPQEWAEPVTSNQPDYRTKARLGVRYDRKKDELLIGFRELRSNKITRMQHCKVLDQRVGNKITELKALFSNLSIRDAVPQIEVACTVNVVCLVIRHLEPFSEQDKQLLCDFATQHNFFIYGQPKGPDSIYLLQNEEPTLLLTHPKSQVELQFAPLDFTQVNIGVNQQMVQQALEWLELTPQDSVLDCFCGLGNFSLPVAKKAGTVLGIEGCDLMVGRASENSSRNQLPNTRFIAQDLFKEGWDNGINLEPFNKVLLDPPRSGAEQICQQMQKINPERIVYVSCNPITLARDTAILLQQGYRLQKLGIMDMFPHTSHVESMALFTK